MFQCKSAGAQISLLFHENKKRTLDQQLFDVITLNENTDLLVKVKLLNYLCKTVLLNASQDIYLLQCILV